jgi:hypothetical protein
VIDLQRGSKTLKPPPGFTCPRQSLRGCFTSPGAMTTYFEYVLPLIDAFFQQTWPSMPLPDNVYFLTTGAKMKEPCSDPAVPNSNFADDTAYEFCGADNNVYIGEKTAYLFYSQAGDVAPATGLAHEFGHHVQALSGVPEPQTNIQSRGYEQQADCVSGAFLGFVNNHHLLATSDIAVLQKYLVLIADAENDPNRDHGTFTERGNALQRGGEGNITSCNAFYPDFPIA